MIPAENSKPPSGGTITTDWCLTHIRDAAHSESASRVSPLASQISPCGACAITLLCSE